MNVMSRKKKYKFQVEFSVLELEHVPLVNQLVYTKIRLLDGGGFTRQSERQKVVNQSVKWDAKFEFECKMTANPSTGELDNSMCRVSVRKELRGGKSYEKLGFADVNLAEFAGSGGNHRYLLQAYDTKHRLLNSTLTVAIHMTITSGDPCFKAKERSGVLNSTGTGSGSNSDSVLTGNGFKRFKLNGKYIRGKDDSLTVWASTPAPHLDSAPPAPKGSHSSLTSSGYNSLNKKAKEEGDNLAAGHSRNSSNTSNKSHASGYVSEHSGHIRSSSLGSPICIGEVPGVVNPVATGRMNLIKASTGDLSKESRVEATRVDADDIIEQIFQKTIEEHNQKRECNESHDEPGLQLYLGVDGKPTIDSKGRGANIGPLKPVVLHKR